MSGAFEDIVARIEGIGLQKHGAALLGHAEWNRSFVKKSLREMPKPVGEKALSAVVISAGPSLARKKTISRILQSKYKGTIIAVDAAYVACLRQGLIPDFVVTLDPHPTRMVRWFGDPNFEKNSEGDDYFARQDLDPEFRRNSIETNAQNIELVNRHSRGMKVAIASSAPPNITERLMEAGFDLYWWNPLVDQPSDPMSLTRKLYEMNRLPSLNTGGNVGTASWVFAMKTLGIPQIALTGMDFGYYADLPYEQTQTFYELLEHIGDEEELKRKFFPKFQFPFNNEKFYTDPTYFWYRRNLLELLRLPTTTQTYNCTEGGTVFGPGIESVSLDMFLDGSCWRS